METSQTRRTPLNHYWVMRGLGRLLDAWEEPFRWLYDKDGTDRLPRRMILAELGRMPDPGDALAIARLVCEQKPRTREVVAKIRRWRRDGGPTGFVGDLTGAILRAIRDYTGGHAMTTDEILAALVEAEQCHIMYRDDDDAD